VLEHLKEKLVYNYTIKSYYEKLYITKYPDENLTSNYIFDTKLENRLQDQDQSICEEECSNAINNMKSNKAPGFLELRDPPF
jgi:hypothetical protein